MSLDTADTKHAAAQAWDEARAVVERQAQLLDLMHFDRPSDFRKGVLSALVAVDRANPYRAASIEDS